MKHVVLLRLNGEAKLPSLIILITTVLLGTYIKVGFSYRSEGFSECFIDWSLTSYIYSVILFTCAYVQYVYKLCILIATINLGTGASWYKINVEHTSFIRVNYDSQNWKRLINHLTLTTCQIQ